MKFQRCVDVLSGGCGVGGCSRAAMAFARLAH
jgi:hypothetical protein